MSHETLILAVVSGDNFRTKGRLFGDDWGSIAVAGIAAAATPAMILVRQGNVRPEDKT